MNSLKLALFDVDGVLLDSLTPHLKICEDKNREYNLGLLMPNAQEFKKLVRTGVRISPMEYFFLAVGFPPAFAKKANKQYQDVFMERYAPRPFPGVERMLGALHEGGVMLGMVTSNVTANVTRAMGPSMAFFRHDCLFTKDEMPDSSKADAIMLAMQRSGAAPHETVYVGDQPADWEAARKAGVNFLGAAYGWGISGEEDDFPSVRSLMQIASCLLGRPVV